MKKIPEIIQEETSDCGICCLESIIVYYNGFIPLETLRINTNTDIDGCNAYELINCAKKYGFNAYGKKIEKIYLDFTISYPLIAHLKLNNNYYHFVVIYKIKDNYIYIMDPAIGRKKLSLDEFNKDFTGVLLYFEPINLIPHYKKNKFLNKEIKKEFLNNKKSYGLIILFSLFILILSLIINIEINILSNNLNYSYILIIVIISNEILILNKNKILLNLTNNFNKSILNNFINFIFELPLKYLKLKRSGEMQTRFIELNELSNNIISLILDFFFDFIFCILLLIILLFINIKITLLLIILSFLYIFINIKIYKKLIKYIRYSINLEETYNSNIIEYIKYIETIKNLNKYDYFINNIENNIINKNNINKKLNYKIYIINFINNLIINIFLLLILVIVIKFNFNIINSLSIFILVNYFISLIKRIISYYPLFLTYKTTINKNNDFLSCEIKTFQNKPNNYKQIKLHNIVYKINNLNILNNINFSIKRKDKIYVYGKSGIGKSTLMRLLTKEIDNYSGLISIDNKDLRESDISNLITYTSQNEYLFDDSILNNITLKENIDNKILNDIIKICKIDKFIKDKTSGLDSIIINNSNISGGEKNRIILARSLIHSKEIIILDEVLKEVDKQLEIEILKDVINYFKEKTIIYISHSNVGFLFKKHFNFRKE